MSDKLSLPPSFDDFVKIFNRLSVALRAQADESGATLRVYFEALKDLPLALLASSATMLMKESGRRFFPTTAEWRTAAEKIQIDQRRQFAAREPRDWQTECENCDDTGWERFVECTGDETCGRKNPHLPHSYVRVCPCRPTNRTYQRHHAS